jgi:hypothetical protein
MKRILTTAAIVVALSSPAALAQADLTMLRNQIDDRVENVDVDALTDEQVRALYAVLASEEDPAARQNAVESIVRDAQYEYDETLIMTDPEYAGRLGASNDIRNAVANLLEPEPVDVDVDTLTDEQVSALYVELTSGDATDAQDIEAIIE